MSLVVILFVLSTISICNTKSIPSVTPAVPDQVTTINMTKASIRQALVANGWYIPSPDSDYAYKRTFRARSWVQSRRLCRKMNADLSVTIKDDAVRWKVAHALYAGPVWLGFWVGLNDEYEDGRWRWIDGTLARSNDIVWSPFEPNGKKGENCGEMWGEERFYTMNDASCNNVDRLALCEQKI